MESGRHSENEKNPEKFKVNALDSEQPLVSLKLHPNHFMIANFCTQARSLVILG